MDAMPSSIATFAMHDTARCNNAGSNARPADVHQTPAMPDTHCFAVQSRALHLALPALRHLPWLLPQYSFG